MTDHPVCSRHSIQVTHCINCLHEAQAEGANGADRRALLTVALRLAKMANEVDGAGPHEAATLRVVAAVLNMESRL